MPLANGTRLGPYEVIAPAGAGGMGEVYRARDTRLNRDVAIKVLPDHLSSSPELRERFEREAKAISQLSHPHICVLYDIGKHEGADYLVLEYLEGETLGMRLLRGPLPTEQVLKYGAQMADALEKAHRHGVVHRDLKPDNVMLTKSGVKLLDFGLAKPAIGAVGVATSSIATMTHSPLTTEGTLVGTFQYMAPEQLEGQEADARSDIFGLGCVLYELASGKRAFEGKSTAKVVAAILTTDPAPLSTVAPLVPPGLERAIRKCLAKDPEERWQSAGDLASELRWILESGSQAGVAIPAAVRTQRNLLRWGALGLALAIGAVAGFLLNRPADGPLLRVAVNLPSGSALVAGRLAVLSPDGQRVVMLLTDAEGKTGLWVRQLGLDSAHPLEDTDGATDPFWSPDSQWIAYFSVDGKLRKSAAGGGASEVIADIPWVEAGGTWNADGLIVYAAARSGLYKVPSSGGTPTKVPTKESTGGVGYTYPSFLPDGKHVLAIATGVPRGISVITVATGEEQSILRETTSYALYAEPGYLLFLRKGSLVAQPFSTRSLRASGSAQSLAESVNDGQLSFSVSRNGLLLYQESYKSQLTWVDGDGNKLSTIGEPGYFSYPHLSPDGKYAVVQVADRLQNKSKLWLYDLHQGTGTPFTFGDGEDFYATWSPDGKQIAFASRRAGGPEDIYLKSVGGGSEQLLLSDGADKEPDAWSPDARFLLYDYHGKNTKQYDVWALPLFGDRKPFPVAQGEANENWGIFSPDGKWVAYQSDESGRAELFVVPFPNPGGKWQVSTKGSSNPFWPPGKEIFYLGADFKIMAVDFETQGSNFIVGKSHPILGGRLGGSILGADVARDGKRWLLILPVEEPNVSPLILTTNWLSALKH